MKRGELWTAAGGTDYASKPRPVVIVQDDSFDQIDSVTVCPITSDPAPLPLFRLTVEPSAGNGLRTVSRVMADKITTMRKRNLGHKIGELDSNDIARLNRAMIVFLGLA